MSWIIAFFCILLVVLLIIPIVQSAEFFSQVLPSQWLQMEWLPELGQFGFGISFSGSLLLSFLTLPLTLVMAWLLAYQISRCKRSVINLIAMSIIQTWSSLPSVIIGVWAISELVPLIRDIAGSGYCLLSATLGLTVFLTPAISLLFMQSYEEYENVYGDLEEAYELSWWQRTAYFIRGCHGEITHISIYTFCRIFGETMIVLMLTGNSLLLPSSLFDPIRTMTATIALEMAYASGLHELSLFALSSVSIALLAILIVGGSCADKKAQ